MATTGTKQAPGITPDETVAITNGVPNKTSVSIDPEGVVQFDADGQNYLLEFYDRFNDRHPAVLVYLAANSSVTVVGGSTSEDQNATCWYNVESYNPPAAPKPVGGGVAATGGVNKIIIGSGNADAKE
jgi:hypothetical protein